MALVCLAADGGGGGGRAGAGLLDVEEDISTAPEHSEVDEEHQYENAHEYKSGVVLGGENAT